MVIEPTRPAWKAGILAIELHPHIGNENYDITNEFNSQGIFKKIFSWQILITVLYLLTIKCVEGIIFYIPRVLESRCLVKIGTEL